MMLALAYVSLQASVEVSLYIFSLSRMGFGCIAAARTPCWVQAVPFHPDIQPVVIALIT